VSEDPIKMIDVSGKKVVSRKAVAAGVIKLKASTVEAIREGKIKKGDPLTVGEIAAILAVKKTPELIPLCHNIPIGKAHVEYKLEENSIEARCTVTTNAQTGVEMEALAGVTTALLNIWDMTKYLEKDENGQYPDAVITDIRVLEKVKGK
jgi:cyclic pyranopterin monophosphate synthase